MIKKKIRDFLPLYTKITWFVEVKKYLQEMEIPKQKIKNRNTFKEKIVISKAF